MQNAGSVNLRHHFNSTASLQHLHKGHQCVVFQSIPMSTVEVRTMLQLAVAATVLELVFSVSTHGLTSSPLPMCCSPFCDTYKNMHVHANLAAILQANFSHL